MLSVQELFTSTAKELQLELETARRELLRVRMGTKTKHLKDTSLASKQKRYIARILTILHRVQEEDRIKKEKVKK